MTFKEFCELNKGVSAEQIAEICMADVKSKIGSARSTLLHIEKQAEEITQGKPVDPVLLLDIINDAGLVSHEILNVMTMLCLKVGGEGLIR